MLSSAAHIWIISTISRLRLAHDVYATTRHRAQKTFLLEQRHRLANRRAAHAERFGQILLVEPDFFARTIDVRLGDRLPQSRIRLVAQRNRRIDRCQRKRQPIGCFGRIRIRAGLQQLQYQMALMV